MTVLITLTTAGADSGPFDLYTNLDGYVSAFATGVSKSALLAGYSSSLVPDYTNIIRVKSVGVCNNYIDISLISTTTTTTTASVLICNSYEWSVGGITEDTFITCLYTDCYGVGQSINGYYGAIGPGPWIFCALPDSITVSVGIITLLSECTTTTTTTLVPTTTTTTTGSIEPTCYAYIAGGTNAATVTYIDCSGIEASAFYDGPSASGYDQVNFCARSIIDPGASEILNNEGLCV